MSADAGRDLRVVTTTLPTREDAERLARAAIEDHLAACAQIQGPITSVFRWDGALRSDTEWYCHLKTTAAGLNRLESRLVEWHPYDVPEIIATPVDRSFPAYAAWVAAEVSPRPES